MLNRIAQLIAKHKMVKPGDTLVVAVSGGADSLCLLHVLLQLRQRLDISLHVAHLDHMLRGSESSADAAFVQATAHAWGVSASLETTDVAAYAVEHRLNLHDAARRVRYAWLTQVAAQIGAQAIATAHTANDQAETVLMHLLRGAGTEGLAGMQTVERYRYKALQHESNSTAVLLVRPLLGITRVEIEAYCNEYALEPRDDATNSDTTYTRNRIRHQLLPLLASYNPRIVEALGRTAAANADADMVVQTTLDRAWPTLVRSHPGGITFDGTAWGTLQPALQRAALRRAYGLLGGSETLGWEHVEQARALLQTVVGKRLPLPSGIWLEVGYGGEFSLGMTMADGPQLIDSPIEIIAPGKITLDDSWMIESGTGVYLTEDRWCIALDYDALEPPVVARVRRPGDRMQPAGGRGSRSLQDMFVDAKLPRALRDRWPVIADARRIVWVPGIRAAEGCAATAASKRSVWIRIVAPDRK